MTGNVYVAVRQIGLPNSRYMSV